MKGRPEFTETMKQFGKYSKGVEADTKKEMDLENELKDGKYDVKEIVDHRLRVEYRVHFKGYSSGEDVWYVESDFSDNRELLEDYRCENYVTEGPRTKSQTRKNAERRIRRKLGIREGG